MGVLHAIGLGLLYHFIPMELVIFTGLKHELGNLALANLFSVTTRLENVLLRVVLH